MVKFTHLEPPLLRVSRPVSACSRCRAAKIKCDGKLPACTACERTGREAECSSAHDQFAKGKERSYVAALEARIEHLEKKRRDLRMKQPMPKVKHEPGTKQEEATDMDDLISDLGFMAINATSRDFYGFTSAMSFARLVITFSTAQELPRSFERRLPPRHAVTAIVQHYIDNISILYPFIGESSIFTSLDNVYQQDGRNATERDFWLVYMIFAISSHSLSRHHGDSSFCTGVNYLSAALEYVDSVLYPGTVYGIQACLLLTLYAMVDPSHLDSWYLIGVAVRILVDLGWHQDPPKQYADDDAKLDLRRRIYHCVYALDRSISMIHARPSSFSDHTTSVAFPRYIKQELETTWIKTSPPVGPALSLFKLRHLQSSWYQTPFHSSKTNQMDSTPYIFSEILKLKSWWTGLDVPPNVLDTFQLELLYSYVYILAPRDSQPMNSDIAKELTFEYAIMFADTILPMARNNSLRAWYSFHDALKCYFIGRQFLDNLLRDIDKLTGLVPMDLHTYQDIDLPLRADKTQNAARALSCLNAYIEVLKIYGRRWQHAVLFCQELQKESGFVIARLQGGGMLYGR